MLMSLLGREMDLWSDAHSLPTVDIVHPSAAVRIMLEKFIEKVSTKNRVLPASLHSWHVQSRHRIALHHSHQCRKSKHIGEVEKLRLVQTALEHAR